MLRRNFTCFKHLPFLLFLSFAFVAINFINNKTVKPSIKDSIEIRRHTLNTNILNLFSLGNRRLISSYLWTKTLLESDIKHSKDYELTWMYYRFDAISDLDPYFYENYLYGGIYLSIIKDDLYGAAKIYEKGLVHYPTDYKLLYNTAFNYYFEIGDNEKALEKYKLLLSHPHAKNFKILPRLIATISAGSKNKEVGFNLLLNSYLKMDEGIVKDRTKTSLYTLRSEIDLGCLNTNSNICRKVDFYGNPYIKENGVWRSKENYKKLKQRRKKKRKAP